jgi:two-component sensor histidine kinase
VTSDLFVYIDRPTGSSVLNDDVHVRSASLDSGRSDLGLIVNELVANALKYAFPNETKGTVVVTLKRVPGEFAASKRVMARSAQLAREAILFTSSKIPRPSQRDS